MRKLPSLLLGIAMTFSGFAGVVQAAVKDGHLVNVDKQGVILDGYDAVAYFTDGKPVKGDPKLQTTYQGAIYHFASAEHKAAFEAEPEKYAPQFGGYCAYGVSKGSLAPIDVEAFSIVDGRLLLQYSAKIKRDWDQDVPGHLTKADKNWPGLLKEEGATPDKK